MAPVSQALPVVASPRPGQPQAGAHSGPRALRGSCVRPVVVVTFNRAGATLNLGIGRANQHGIQSNLCAIARATFIELVLERE
jgi:hypothetical protein